MLRYAWLAEGNEEDESERKWTERTINHAKYEIWKLYVWSDQKISKENAFVKEFLQQRYL